MNSLDPLEVLNFLNQSSIFSSQTIQGALLQLGSLEIAAKISEAPSRTPKDSRSPHAPPLFLSLLEFQGVLSHVAGAALQGCPPRAPDLALVEALVEQVHSHLQNHCEYWLLGARLSS